MKTEDEGMSWISVPSNTISFLPATIPRWIVMTC